MTCQRAVIFHSISIKRLSQCQIYKFSDTLRPWIFVDAKNLAWNVLELLGKHPSSIHFSILIQQELGKTGRK